MFLLLGLVASVVGKLEIIKDIESEDSWVYLGKFCYAEDGGKFEVALELKPDQIGQTFCFYSDWSGQWPITYDNKDVLSCQEKQDRAARCVNITTIEGYSKGFYELKIKSSIPRWWFVTLSNCIGGEYPVKLEQASIGYYNPDSGSYTVEFSRDMHRVPQMAMAFGVIYLLLLLLMARSKMVAKARNVTYEILRLCAISMVFASVAMWLKFFHYLKFDDDGRGLDGLYILSFFLEGCAQMVLIGVMVDVSRGYTISTNFVAQRKLTYATLVIYLLCHILLYVWDVTVSDPASVLYIYESLPGYFIIALRILILLAILKNYFDTYNAESKKQRKTFYLAMATYSTCWMLALPITALIASSVPSYERRWIVFAISNTVDVVSYFIVWYIFRPWEGNRFISVLDPLETVPFGNNDRQVFPTVAKFDGF